MAVPPTRIETLRANPPVGSHRLQSRENTCFISLPIQQKEHRVAGTDSTLRKRLGDMQRGFLALFQGFLRVIAVIFAISVTVAISVIVLGNTNIIDHDTGETTVARLQQLAGTMQGATR